MKKNQKPNSVRSNDRPHGKPRTSMRGKQGRKDSESKRVNFDNESRSKFDKEYEPRDKRKPAANDPKWYFRTPELSKAASSYVFSNVVGQSMPYKFRVSGIMAFGWTPTLGNDRVMAAKQSFDSIYSYVTHANSRNTTYSANDMGLTIIAAGQVFAAVSHLIRAYGVAKMYDATNLYTPKYILESMGFEFEPMVSKLGDYWFNLNRIISRCQQLWIPNVMPLIERWFWLNNKIFRDAEGAKAQYYFFVPANFLILNDRGFEFNAPVGGVSEKSGTVVESVYYNNKRFMPYMNVYTPDEWFAVVDMMLDALINSEYRGVIMGDLLKAYGSDKLYVIPEITSDYATVPEYNTEVLMQMEHIGTSNLVTEFIADRQTSTNLVTHFMYAPSPAQGPTAMRGFIHPKTGIINIHKGDAPTNEDIMEATRLMTLGAIAQPVLPILRDSEGIISVEPPTEDSNGIVVPMVYGSEMICGFKICTLGSGGLSEYSWMGTGSHESDLVAKWCQFDWAPILYSTAFVTNGTSLPAGIGTAVAAANRNYDPELLPVLDYDNYTLVSIEELGKMHTAALYSELGLPIL